MGNEITLVQFNRAVPVTNPHFIRGDSLKAKDRLSGRDLAFNVVQLSQFSRVSRSRYQFNAFRVVELNHLLNGQGAIPLRLDLFNLLNPYL